MPKIAFMTFSILRAPYGDPLVREFEERTEAVFTEAEQASGFIARATASDDVEWKTNYQKDWGCWGPFAVPRFYLAGTAQGHTRQAQTLSIWQDLASVWRFAYRGPLHRTALQKRHDWFGRQDWPIYCAWWIDDRHQPTWPEACERLEWLHDTGPTPYAFTFRRMFDAEGHLLSIDALNADAPRDSGAAPAIAGH